MTPHAPRLAGGRLLGTRLTAAALSSRHENVVRRYCDPIACDVPSHALLYDLDDACHVLRELPRRSRRVA